MKRQNTAGNSKPGMYYNYLLQQSHIVRKATLLGGPGSEGGR